MNDAKSLFAQNAEIAENLDEAADPTPTIGEVSEAAAEVYDEQYSHTANQNVEQETLTPEVEQELATPEAEVEIPEMSTAQYEAVQRQIAQRLQEAKERDRASDLNTIKVLMQKHGFKTSDIKVKGATRQSSGKVAPKYRDPKTGATWTGRGIAPKWIADTPKDQRDQFLIKE